MDIVSQKPGDVLQRRSGWLVYGGFGGPGEKRLRVMIVRESLRVVVKG